MASTKVVEMVLCGQRLPQELRHQSSGRQGEENKIAARLSGVVLTRMQDEVICPSLVLRNLVVPLHPGPASQNAVHPR